MAGGFMSHGNGESSSDQNAQQLSDLSTTLTFDNVNVDSSTTIGLQGDDLSVIAQLLGNQFITSQTALVSQNNQLAKIVESGNETKANMLETLKGSGKWALYLALAGVALFFSYKILKR